jgi:nucleotide-binding universal stress UspA family protein
MYKKILVPLDGSIRAEMILPHAEDLAGRYQAEVILLNSIEHYFSANGEGIFIEFSKASWPKGPGFGATPEG